MKLISLLFITTGLFACSPGTTADAAMDAAPLDPVCVAIMDHCHPYATGPGVPMDCHTLAEANDGTVCRARQAECFAACVPPTDSAVDTDASGDAMDMGTDVYVHMHGG